MALSSMISDWIFVNLVPRVHWLFGQREGASRDSGIMEFFYPRKRGIPVFVRMPKFKTEVKCLKIAAMVSNLEGVRESQS